jgi:hypothetical protein
MTRNALKEMRSSSKLNSITSKKSQSSDGPSRIRRLVNIRLLLVNSSGALTVLWMVGSTRFWLFPVNERVRRDRTTAKQVAAPLPTVKAISHLRVSSVCQSVSFFYLASSRRKAIPVK